MDKWKEERQEKTHKAADALNERIRAYFEEQTPREQSISIQVDPGEQQAECEGQEVYRTVKFVLPDGTLFEGYYDVSNVGGNMYTVKTGIGERSAEFSISLPEASAASEDNYSRPICEFLLEEIERLAGELHLREESPRT